MDSMVIGMVLLSAFMHALRNFFNKKALDKQIFMWWFEVFGLLFFTPVFFFAGDVQSALSSLSPLWILISGAVHFIYWFFLTKSLDKGDLSLVYPIMRSSPALVLIFSLALLGETISLLGVTGILLVAVGVYTIHMQHMGFQALAQPLRSIIRDRAVQFAFLTLLSVATYSIVDKIAVDSMDPVAFAYSYPWISLGLFTVYLSQTKTKSAVKREWQIHKGSILICGILGIFGYFLILMALSMERVSYVVGLRQLSIVFAVFLGGHFLKESNRWIRMASSGVIFLGCYFIIIAD
jgi:uncharacterized membrane protein